MTDSILETLRKLSGLSPEDDSFDLDIMTHAETIFNVVSHLGYDPPAAFPEDLTGATWAMYLGNRTDLHMIKTYICLRTKLMFDPPTNATVVNLMKEEIRELEWRINNKVDTGYVTETASE